MSSRQALELERARLAERFAEQPEGRLFAPLADVHRKLGDLDTALELCLTGLAKHPRYSSAHLILGKIQLDRGEDEAAIEAFEKVLELDPANLLALRQLAELAEAAGDYDRAEELWLKIAELEPNSEESEQRIAWIRARRERDRDDEEAARSATNPDEPADEPADDTEVPASAEAAGDTEATSESGAGVEGADEAAAPSEPSKAREVPSTEIATMTLAEIYAGQGFRSKALEIYRQIEARNPDVPGLQEKIAAIETDLARVEHSLEAGAQGPDEVEDLAEISEDVPETVLATGESTSRAEGDDRPEVRPSAPLTAPTSAESEEEQEAERFDHFRSWLDRVRADED